MSIMNRLITHYMQIIHVYDQKFPKIEYENNESDSYLNMPIVYTHNN